MIRYALVCDLDHEFEGWFASSRDYDAQEAAGLTRCPVCDVGKVRKQMMAPGVAGTKRGADHQDMLMQAMGRLRDHVERTFDDVGETFADEARAIHEGRAEDRAIYGRASGDEIAGLVKDGIAVAPLPPRPPKPTDLN